jgi:uncharacterized protein YkwD
MKKLWLLALIPAILAFFYFNTTKGTEKPLEPVKQPEISSQPKEQPKPPNALEIFRLVNEERAKVGVAPLQMDTRLLESAQEKVDELDREGWDDTPHVSDAGVRGVEIAKKYFPNCAVTSENLLYNTYTSRGGIDWWLSSPPHKEAMLDSKYTLTGIAVKNGYVAQHFCQP